MYKIKLMLVDDDQEFVKLLSDYLTNDGFSVTPAYSGREALDLLNKQAIDLCILDVMMPGIDGIETLKLIREDFKALPVIMLTAKAEPIDKVLGLELGADDYIAKPPEPRELTARIKAVLRRINAQEMVQDKNNEISWDDNQRQFFIHDKEISLTGIEYEVLKVLATELGNVVAKERISEIALQRPLKPFDRSLDVHISNIRKKLTPYNVNIKSIRGRGYQLVI